MKRQLCFAALMATTALIAQPVQAQPAVVGFVQGIAAGIAGSAVLGGSLGAAGFVSGIAASTFFGSTLVGRLLVSLASSAILAALAPKPQVPPPSALLANYAQPISYQERGYGTVRKGGPKGFTGFTSDKRHYTVLIAAHSTRGPVAHNLDRREVAIDGSGDVQTEPMYGYGKIRTYTGKVGQTTDPDLLAAFPEITAAHDYAGLSYGAITAARPPQSVFTQVYPNSREWEYNPVWDMHDEIYDPRTGVYDWTDNWALCFAHELVNYFGQEVDWDDVAIEAGHCDQLVTNGEGGQQPRWTFNRYFRDDQSYDEVQAQFLGAADGFVFERPDGKVGFYCGRWIEPTITLTEQDFIAVNVSEGKPGELDPNEFLGQYVEPANGYLETPTAVLEFPDGTLPRRDEIQLFGADSHNQAVRALSRYTKSKRARYAIQGTIKMIGYEVMTQRFVNFHHTELGMEFPIEVRKLVRNGDGLTFNIEAESTSREDFEGFVAATDEPPRPSYNEVASDDAVDLAVGLTGMAEDSTGGTAAILWDWPDQKDSLTQDIRVRKSGGQWEEFKIPEGQSFFRQTGLADGTTYEAQVRNKTAAFRSSDWRPVAPVSVLAVANSVAPAALADFDATAMGSNVNIDITAPNDPVYFATRIYRGTTTTFGDATVVRTEYGNPSSPDSWQDTPPAPGTYYYWGEPINQSGIGEPLNRSGPESAMVL